MPQTGLKKLRRVVAGKQPWSHLWTKFTAAKPIGKNEVKAVKIDISWLARTSPLRSEKKPQRQIYIRLIAKRRLLATPGSEKPKPRALGKGKIIPQSSIAEERFRAASAVATWFSDFDRL